MARPSPVPSVARAETLIHAHERLEDAILLLLRDPAPGIAHANATPPSHRNRMSNGSLPWRGVNLIALREKVEQNLLELLRIGHARSSSEHELGVELQPLRHQLRQHQRLERPSRSATLTSFSETATCPLSSLAKLSTSFTRREQHAAGSP